MKTAPCQRCAAARKVLPAPLRRRLEDLERRRTERKEAERARGKA